MLDNVDIMSENTFETVEKILTDGEDYHKCTLHVIVCLSSSIAKKKTQKTFKKFLQQKVQ